MSELWTLIDQSIGEAINAHPDYVTPKGKEALRKVLVRKITMALRDSLSATKVKTDEPADTPPPTHLEFTCWSKGWWAALLFKISKGESTDYMLHHAMQSGSRLWVQPVAEMFPKDVVESLKGYPTDGPEMEAWHPWFLGYGVKLPQWRERQWVFLPSPVPPGSPSTAPEISDEDARELARN